MEQGIGIDPAEPTKKPGNRKRNLLVGCVGLVLLVICGCLVVSAASLNYFGRFIGEPEGLVVRADYPWSVQRGDRYDLILSLSNQGSQAITIDDILLDEAFGPSVLDGMVVEGSDPNLVKDYTVPGIKAFLYNQTIDPGETQTVTFHLLASEQGQFGGTIGIYVGDLAVRQDVSVTVLP